MGNFLAVILGAFLIQFISYFPQLVGLSNIIPPQFKQVLFGLILVVMMIWRPQGILGRAPRMTLNPKKKQPKDSDGGEK
jgi:branched-chain amino acid transport system permease protein